MAGRTGFRPHDREAPVGAVRERGPDLLTLDHPFVAVEHRGSGRWRGRCPRSAPRSPGTTARRRPGWPEGDGASARRCRTGSVGANSPSPKNDTRAGASAFAYSSWKTTCCANDAARPPYSAGHESPTQRSRPSSRSHSRRVSQPRSSAGPPRLPRVANSPVRCSASHARTSARKLASSGESWKSMRATTVLDRAVKYPGRCRASCASGFWYTSTRILDRGRLRSAPVDACPAARVRCTDTLTRCVLLTTSRRP